MSTYEKTCTLMIASDLLRHSIDSSIALERYF